MTHSMKWVSDPENREKVLTLYRSRKILRVVDIAKQLNTTESNVFYVTHNYIPSDERKALKAIRLSVSKTGKKNPMHGKKGEAHHNWVGECENGFGYLTCLHNGKRQFVHRVVMAKALGLSALPRKLYVHHIDGNKKNNSLDNLALVTTRGHHTVHKLQTRDTKSLEWQKSTLAEILRSTT